MKKLKKLATSLPKNAKLSNATTSKIRGGNGLNLLDPSGVIHSTQGADKRLPL